ncbi:TadE/TadG family type IV pilus assembly protein [Youngiibacter multivorans]|uniref:Putative Flp pilus-assembly TadG-like N-terminal domain-containing protein n=1 Tax=Youngiibacter multivorans TaxID=937251 RepID=A0ABS4G8D5_9CLOT|nr:TadE/TadG family type IV pilus assembly protein [Youngiibacter multivorans]MBP1920804.1 hypothetical protein [Youngiibacter multivorans]
MKRKSLKMLMKNEDGAVVVIVALMMTVLMGFAALAIDVGFMYNQRRSLQNAADAGALAGVLEIELSGDYESAAITAVQKNIDIPVENIDVTLVSAKTVKVDVEQVAERIFSVFLTSTDSMVGASATAQKIAWYGEALPFLNQDSYKTDLGVWEKLDTNSGNFESIKKEEYTLINPSDDKHDISQVYFLLDYDDGIAVDNGAIATIKQEVEAIYDRNYLAGFVYVLSLKDSVIASTKVKLITGDVINITDLSTTDIVHVDQLMLLKCSFDEYASKWDTAKLTVLAEYDIANGDFPANYIEPEGRAARLID